MTVTTPTALVHNSRRVQGAHLCLAISFRAPHGTLRPMRMQLSACRLYLMVNTVRHSECATGQKFRQIFPRSPFSSDEMGDRIHVNMLDFLRTNFN